MQKRTRCKKGVVSAFFALNAQGAISTHLFMKGGIIWQK